METAIIIPARFESKRLPGKLLKKAYGKPLIQYTVDLALASGAGDVIVATDCDDIAKAVQGCSVFVTGEHSCGTDRVAEANQYFGYDFVINLQADSVMVEPKWLKFMSGIACGRRAGRHFLTLGYETPDKVIYKKGLFTRRYVNHIGVYGFSKEGLKKFSETEPLDDGEGLEQTRLGREWTVLNVCPEREYFAIDTEKDLDKFRGYLINRFRQD